MLAFLTVLSIISVAIGSIMLANNDILGIGLSCTAIVLAIMAHIVQTSDHHKEVIATLTGSQGANERKQKLEKEFERLKQKHLG